MEKTINIFGVEMGCMSAKEAMVNAIRFLEDDPIDTIELMTMDMLMAGQDDTGWKEQVAALDLVIPEEAEILEAAGVQERNLLKEAGERTFLRMFMKYLQKNQGRIFLLAESEEELKRLEDALRRYNRGVRVAGHAVLAERGGAGGKCDQRDQWNGDGLYLFCTSVPSPGAFYHRIQSAP